MDKPCPVVTTVDRFAKVQAEFISMYYGGHPDSKNKSTEEPDPTLTVKDRLSLVSTKFIDQQYGCSKPVTIDKPLGCITAKPKYNLISCQPWIVSKTASIEVRETDSEPMRRIKEFMALYGIIDIKMRMLKIPELKRIMGFPEDYTLIGTQTEQKKYIGNAVEVNVACVLCEAIINELNKIRL
jgi:DNA (cytosine-5)-methyltransferase 1